MRGRFGSLMDQRADRIDQRRYAPLPAVARDYGRRNDERLYEADVRSVRAVVDFGVEWLNANRPA